MKMICKILVLAILVCFCGMAQEDSTAASLPRTLPARGRGISARLTELAPAQLEKALTNMNQIGATWLRMDFPWSEIQGAGQAYYDVANYDRVVEAAFSHKINLLGIIDYCPSWANGNQGQFYPPTNPSDYGTFAAYLANRYKGMGVHHWEIWNEPNLGGIFWDPVADPVGYTALLKAGYTAIKAADPMSTVLSGGLAPAGDASPTMTPQTFLAAVYSNGGGAYFDAVGDHPYTYPALANATDGSAYWWTQMYSGENNLRSIMIANGDAAKLIWMTEYGAPTGGGSSNGAVTEATQADMVTVAYNLRASYSWAGPLFWYTYQDSGTDPTNVEDWFGLVRFDGSFKPAFSAYAGIRFRHL